MKKMLIAAGLALSVAFGTVSAAEAKTKVDIDIYLGSPHYKYQVDKRYKYRKGHGWYLPTIVIVGGSNRISCGMARNRVMARGYHNVSTVECSGPTYTFRGTYRGHRYRLIVNARSGDVWRG